MEQARQDPELGTMFPGTHEAVSVPPVPRGGAEIDRVAGDAIPEEVRRMIENISPQQRLALAFG